MLYHLVDPSKAEDWYNSFLSDSNYAKNIVEMVKSKTIKEQTIDKNTLQLIDLITQMLNPNPKQRPHASQLLKHQIFADQQQPEQHSVNFKSNNDFSDHPFQQSKVASNQREENQHPNKLTNFKNHEKKQKKQPNKIDKL